MGKKKEGKKQRKHGRMKAWCQAYMGRMQAERNQARRLVRHLRRFPGDDCAIKVLAALPKQFAKQGATRP